eukprot:5884469-Amphidinium_carterae.1
MVPTLGDLSVVSLPHCTTVCNPMRDSLHSLPAGAPAEIKLQGLLCARSGTAPDLRKYGPQ